MFGRWILFPALHSFLEWDFTCMPFTMWCCNALTRGVCFFPCCTDTGLGMGFALAGRMLSKCCEHRLSMYLCGLSWPLATRTTCSSGWLVEETQNRPVLFQAAVTKYHRQGDLKNRNLFSHSSGGWESETKVSAGLVSSETFLVDLHMAVF